MRLLPTLAILSSLHVTLSSALLLVPPKVREDFDVLGYVENLGLKSNSNSNSKSKRQLYVQDGSPHSVVSHRDRLVPVTLGVMSK